MRILIKFALLLVAISACQPEEIGPQHTNPGDTAAIAGRKIFLVNEGNFGRGGASISVYSPSTKKHHAGIFSAANDGKVLGDVAQHMIQHQGHYYLVVNASGYILVTDTADLRVQDTIRGQMSAPRYMVATGKTGFVTDLFTSKLWKINLETNEIQGYISLSGSGSHILFWQNKLVVAVNDEILLIDPLSGHIDSTVSCNSAIDRIRVGSDGTLWALDMGSGSMDARLYRIESSSIPQQSWRLPRKDFRFLTTSPFRPDELYFGGDDGIYRCRLAGDSLNINRLAYMDLQNTYALDADPVTGDLYLADALDFDHLSLVFRVDTNGVLSDEFRAGIITTSFHFP